MKFRKTHDSNNVHKDIQRNLIKNDFSRKDREYINMS